MLLPVCGHKSARVTLSCRECGVSQTRVITLPEDVEIPSTPVTCFTCSSCNPKAETLERRDDFLLLVMKPKWDAAGGRAAHKRQLARERKRRQRQRAAQYEAAENKLAA